jgi:DNA-binding response OmpR family regulator
MDGKGRGRLLLVEDETVLRRLIAEFLRGEGFDVIEAADGLEGASLYTGHRPFDLVLLDLNLPYLSGVDVCRRIKAVQPDQPVLICSAAILDWHVVELLELDVDQFLTKPYHPLDLLERIAVEMARGSRTADRAIGAGLASAALPEAASHGGRSVAPYPVQSATIGIR